MVWREKKVGIDNMKKPKFLLFFPSTYRFVNLIAEKKKMQIKKYGWYSQEKASVKKKEVIKVKNIVLW